MTVHAPVLVDVFEFDRQARVRLLERDGEYWIPAIDVARALGYGNPSVAVQNLLSRNQPDLEGETWTTKLVVQGQNGETWIAKLATQGQQRTMILLSEQGAYIFAMLAKTPKATRFRRALAAHLRELRRLGWPRAAGADPAVLEMRDRIAALEREVTTLRNVLGVAKRPAACTVLPWRRSVSVLADVDRDAVLSALCRYAAANRGRFHVPRAKRVPWEQVAGIWWDGEAVGFLPWAFAEAVSWGGCDVAAARHLLRQDGLLLLGWGSSPMKVAKIMGRLVRVVAVRWEALFR